MFRWSMRQEVNVFHTPLWLRRYGWFIPAIVVMLFFGNVIARGGAAWVGPFIDTLRPFIDTLLRFRPGS
jgi:hypothetical protein